MRTLRHLSADLRKEKGKENRTAADAHRPDNAVRHNTMQLCRCFKEKPKELESCGQAHALRWDAECPGYHHAEKKGTTAQKRLVNEVIDLEGAPVPGATAEALRQKAGLGSTLWTLGLRRFDLHGSGALDAARALAIGAAGAHLLPLAELRVATIASLVPVTLRVEQSVLVEADLLLEVLVAEDAAALATVMATHKDAEGLLAARSGADGR